MGRCCRRPFGQTTFIILYAKSRNGRIHRSASISCIIHHLWVLYLLAVAGGIFLALDNCFRRSFVSEMVPDKDVANAVVIYSTIVKLVTNIRAFTGRASGSDSRLWMVLHFRCSVLLGSTGLFVAHASPGSIVASTNATCRRYTCWPTRCVITTRTVD